MLPTRDRMDSEIKQIVYEAPRDLKYYNLKFNGLEFQVVTGILYSRKHYILVDVSGNECVSVNIDDKNRLYLSKLKYRPTCAVDTFMKRGESTIQMLKGLLKFVINQEPEYTHVYFDDISEFDCVLPGEGYTIQISLALHNFVIYGKTWYERHFQAELTSNYLKKRIQKSLLKLNAIVEKNEIYTEIVSEVLDTIDTYPKNTKLKLLINECFTNALRIPTRWLDLFHSLFSSDSTLSLEMGSSSYSCSLFYIVRDIFDHFNVPSFTQVSMKLSREVIGQYVGNIAYLENLDPVHKYPNQFGSSRESYKGYPYFREYTSGTRKMRSIRPFKSDYSIKRYFSELPWKKRKTRKNRKGGT